MTPSTQDPYPIETTPASPEIEDHALIGDLGTAALVAKDGSITFLCLPDFDSPSCFASLLGTPDHGRWRIAPIRTLHTVQRRYRGDSLILETDFETDEGAVRLIDLMPIRSGAPRIVRIVEGIRGAVTMEFELHPRFAYGLTVPREASGDGVSLAVAGPDAIYVRGGPYGKAPPFEGEFTVRAGQQVRFELAWAHPYDEAPRPLDHVRIAGS